MQLFADLLRRRDLPGSQAFQADLRLGFILFEFGKCGGQVRAQHFDLVHFQEFASRPAEHRRTQFEVRTRTLQPLYDAAKLTLHAFFLGFARAHFRARISALLR